MKPYALKNFSERFVKDTNIQDVGSYVWTPYLNIKSEYRDDFEIYDDEEYASVSVPYIDLDELLDDPLNYEWCMGSDFDHWEYYDFISQLIKTTNHYLVCAYKCDWRGRTGYKIVDTMIVISITAVEVKVENQFELLNTHTMFRWVIQQ